MPDLTDLIATAGPTTVTTLATLETSLLASYIHSILDALPDLTDLIALAATTARATTVTMLVTLAGDSPHILNPSLPTCPYVRHLVFLKRVTFKLNCFSQLKT
jgi:hypothetical protein